MAVSRQTGLRVLVVDDDADCAESLATLLRLSGHDPVIAGSADEAVKLTDDRRFDVALVELRLRGKDGFQLAPILLRRGVKPLAVTTCGSRLDRSRALDAGYMWHFIKPASPAEILLFLAAAAKTTVKE